MEKDDSIQSFYCDEWNRIVHRDNRILCEKIRQDLPSEDKWIAQALFRMASLYCGPKSPSNSRIIQHQIQNEDVVLSCTYLESKGGDQWVGKGKLLADKYRVPLSELRAYSYEAAGFNVDMSCEYPKWELVRKINDVSAEKILGFWKPEGRIEYLKVGTFGYYLDAIVLEEMPLNRAEECMLSASNRLHDSYNKVVEQKQQDRHGLPVIIRDDAIRMSFDFLQVHGTAAADCPAFGIPVVANRLTDMIYHEKRNGGFVEEFNLEFLGKYVASCEQYAEGLTTKV
ncbi:MAG: hypothetical protein ABIF10_03355 [Candidatus Woesearchaeota archaeon]